MNVIKMIEYIHLISVLKREHKRCIKKPYVYPSFRRAKRIASAILEANNKIGDVVGGDHAGITSHGRYDVIFVLVDQDGKEKFDEPYAFYKVKTKDNDYDILYDSNCHPLKLNRAIAQTLFFYLDNLYMSTGH